MGRTKSAAGNPERGSLTTGSSSGGPSARNKAKLQKKRKKKAPEASAEVPEVLE
jgi:hypothetical protein